MNKPANPTETARETLKQLAVRRIAPTPDHYEAIYHEIAQTPEEARLHPGLRQIVQSFADFPNQTQEMQRRLNELRQNANSENWPEFQRVLFSCLQGQGEQTTLARTWSELIRDLIRQWDLRNPVFTPSRKKEALEKVLINFGSDDGQLNEKLAGLVRSWSETGSENPAASLTDISREFQPETAPASTGSGTGNWAEWRGALVQALQLGIAARLPYKPELQEEATSLANLAARTEDEAGLQVMATRLKKFWIKLELQNDQEMRLCDGLLNLLRLLTDNISDIVLDDAWAQGQIAIVQQLMSQPLDMQLIYHVEASLKEVLFRQSQLRHNMVEAQTTLKGMVATFIDRLGILSDSTDQYHGKISVYAEKIKKANDLPSISHVMEDLLQDTRSMQLDVLRSRDEMREAQSNADKAQEKIRALEQELQSINEKIREDQLTGALNRRGFEEAYEVELARAQRSSQPFALALLDIDNFKKLNDTKGHTAGDAALTHLVHVIKDMLRPTDTVARYGGEEFVLLLPGTHISEAVSVLQRLQRELTKRFFLYNNEKLLITFSAGITLVGQGESQHNAVQRADQAMYQAKRLGKNRVETLLA